MSPARFSLTVTHFDSGRRHLRRRCLLDVQPQRRSRGSDHRVGPRLGDVGEADVSSSHPVVSYVTRRVSNYPTGTTFPCSGTKGFSNWQRPLGNSPTRAYQVSVKRGGVDKGA